MVTYILEKFRNEILKDLFFKSNEYFTNTLIFGLIFLISIIISCSSNEIQPKLKNIEKREKELEKREKELEKREKKLFKKETSTDSINKHIVEIEIPKQNTNENNFEKKYQERERQEQLQKKIKESSLIFKGKPKKFKYLYKNNEPYGKNCLLTYDDFFETYTLTFSCSNFNYTFELKRDNFCDVIEFMNSCSFLYNNKYYTITDNIR